MSSRRHPIPLYPNPPLSPRRTQVDSASDDSDFLPIRDGKSITDPQTQVESASDEHSDFPPIREGKSISDTLLFPCTIILTHPRCSPVARRQSERHSSPSKEPASSQFKSRRRHLPNSVARKPGRHVYSVTYHMIQ